MRLRSRLDKLERLAGKTEDTLLACHVVDYATGKRTGVSFTVAGGTVDYRNGLQYLAPDVAPGHYAG